MKAQLKQDLGVVPAQAGVILIELVSWNSSLGCSRTGGGDPIGLYDLNQQDWLFPHRRG